MPRKEPRIYKKGVPGSEYEDMNARRQSRRAVEKKIGRKLKASEQVDHQDSNPQHKGLKNLKVMSMKENLKKQQAVDNKKPRRASLRNRP